VGVKRWCQRMRAGIADDRCVGYPGKRVFVALVYLRCSSGTAVVSGSVLLHDTSMSDAWRFANAWLRDVVVGWRHLRRFPWVLQAGPCSTHDCFACKTDTRRDRGGASIAMNLLGATALLACHATRGGPALELVAVRRGGASGSGLSSIWRRRHPSRSSSRLTWLLVARVSGATRCCSPEY